MISLFIGLLLLLGMNAIFRSASLAVQAGNALNDATRNARAVTPIFFEDLKNCAKDSPVFIISSSFAPQYLNKDDAAASNAIAGTGPVVTGCILGDHQHRTDMLMFMAHGLYKRKTANYFVNPSPPNTITDSLSSTTTSDEAYIHYGHLRTLANDGVTYVAPDDINVPGQPYASDWVLGRNVTLMVDPAVAANAKDLAGNNEWYYPRYGTGGVATAVSASAGKVALQTGSNYDFNQSAISNMTPLAYNTPTGYNTKTPAVLTQSSRYDLAAATIEQYRSYIATASYIQGSEPPTGGANYLTWWAPFVYTQAFSKLDINPQAYSYPNSYLNSTPGPFPPTPVITYPLPLLPASLQTPQGAAVPTPLFRYNASSILSPNPMTGQDQANLAPFLLEHVTQFIVEYAGDFLTQDSSGNVIDTVPDGQVDWMYATKGDFKITSAYNPGDWAIYPAGSGKYWQAITPVVGVPPGTAAAPLPGVWAATATTKNLPPRQIRWYGMPRDACGCGFVNTQQYVVNAFGTVHNIILFDPNDAANPKAANANELNNVVPLADLWVTSLNNYTRPLPYEVELPGPISNNHFKDYAGTGMTFNNGTNPRYTSVWKNDVPAMVRIVLKLDDPNNAMQDGPWYEYVFKLK